ncbi:MAG: polysaccharide deacetylase family protein [Bacteroidales bacterium]|nr:polysaccharide deacetylase family protein [Bacteroidales bacterium]MCF0189803.1 polysaccharide deacetylase family protein [Marinilabiliaceae bacterium]
MKKLNYLATALLGVALVACNNTVSVDDIQTSICTWQGDSRSAISITFDDACPNQFSIAIPIMNEYGVRGTFFPVVNWLGGDYSNLKEVARQGHEVGSHTMTHPNLFELPEDSARSELNNSRMAIEENIGDDYKCLTIAYPYCVPPTNRDMIFDDYLSARHCDERIEDATPADYSQISSFGLGDKYKYSTAEGMQASIFEPARAKGGWAVLLIHEVENGPGYSPISSEEFRKVLQYLTDNASDYWVAPMGEVTRYAKERDAATVKVVDVAGKIGVKVELAEEMDEETYCIPLTVSIALKDGEAPVLMDIIPNADPVIIE